MNTIKLKRMRLINFMGIRDLEVNFNPDVTLIRGYNGTGKSTLTHAFPWAMFGKNAREVETFSIKTLDESGSVIQQIEHEVQVDFDVNDQEIRIRRVLQEKWVKKRNSATPEMTGNQTLFYWNDVPKKESEYVALVEALIPANLFKLITNPLYFNLNLEWQERREVLFSMAPPVDTEEILSQITTKNNPDQVAVISKMLVTERKTVDEIRLQFNSTAKKIKDELESIPLRVDECYKQMPEEEDFTIYENQIAEQQLVIAAVDKEKQNLLSASKTANEGVMKKQTERNQLQLKIQQMRHENASGYNERLLAKKTYQRELQGQRNDFKNLLLKYGNDIAGHQLTITKNATAIQQLQDENATLLNKWYSINAETFTDGEYKTTCFACSQALPAENIEAQRTEQKTKFEADKAQRLAATRTTGETTKGKIKTLEEGSQAATLEINNLNILIEETKEKLAQKETSLESITGEITLMEQTPPADTDEIKVLEKEYSEFVIPKTDDLNFDQFKARTDEAQRIMKAANEKLANKGAKKRVEDRIEELSQREVTLSGELTDIEALQFVLEAYNKKRIDLLTASVNSKFSQTRFKLFERLTNGTDKEVCVALVNTNGSWVPFPDANNAGQINSGIDIINTLCAYNGITAPIFIDNSEGVGQLIPSASQRVHLRFSQDEKMIIE